MSKRPHRANERERTTLALSGTVRTTEAGLDHSSAFALAWAASWLTRNGSKKVPTGGLVRRALAVYLQHLETCASPADEVRAVSRACAAFMPDEATARAAYERLEAVPASEPLPPHRVLLAGPGGLDMAALDARVEEHIQAIAATRWGRLKGIR